MNLLSVAPKLDDTDWEWISYIMSKFYPVTDLQATHDRMTRDQMMFLDLDKVKAALDRSLMSSVIDRDERLYEKLYGKPYTARPAVQGLGWLFKKNGW